MGNPTKLFGTPRWPVNDQFSPPFGGLKFVSESEAGDAIFKDEICICTAENPEAYLNTLATLIASEKGNEKINFNGYLSLVIDGLIESKAGQPGKTIYGDCITLDSMIAIEKEVAKEVVREKLIPAETISRYKWRCDVAHAAVMGKRFTGKKPKHTTKFQERLKLALKGDK